MARYVDIGGLPFWTLTRDTVPDQAVYLNVRVASQGIVGRRRIEPTKGGSHLLQLPAVLFGVAEL
jgi:hypothetical protein